MKFSKEIIISLLVALVSLIVSGYTAYTRNDKELTGRVVAVETQQKADTAAVIDMKQDLREIRSDVKDLVRWTIGERR